MFGWQLLLNVMSSTSSASSSSSFRRLIYCNDLMIFWKVFDMLQLLECKRWIYDYFTLCLCHCVRFNWWPTVFHSNQKLFNKFKALEPISLHSPSHRCSMFVTVCLCRKHKKLLQFLLSAQTNGSPFIGSALLSVFVMMPMCGGRGYGIMNYATEMQWRHRNEQRTMMAWQCCTLIVWFQRRKIKCNYRKGRRRK